MTLLDWGWAGLWLVLGLFLGAVVRPGMARMERFARRLWREDPLIVHIESNSELMFQGLPDWEPFTVWLPDRRQLALSEAPEGRWDWLNWVRAQGAQDAQTTKLKVTLQAKSEAAVIVDAIRLSVARKEVPAGGIVLTRSVGGADMCGLFISMDLDRAAEDEQNPLLWLGYGEGVPSSRALAAGDVERFEIHANAAAGWFEWSLELHLLVEDRRVRRKVDNDGKPFVTVGVDGLPHLFLDSTGAVLRQE